MAAFAVFLGINPSEYKNLTIREREAIIKAQKKRG